MVLSLNVSAFVKRISRMAHIVSVIFMVPACHILDECNEGAI